MWIVNNKIWYSEAEYKELENCYINAIKQYNSLLEQYNKIIKGIQWADNIEKMN